MDSHSSWVLRVINLDQVYKVPETWAQRDLLPRREKGPKSGGVRQQQ